MKPPSIHPVYLEARQAARRFPFVLFWALADSLHLFDNSLTAPVRRSGILRIRKDTL
jgi:hypothetical protein